MSLPLVSPPRLVPKGWGFERWLHNDERYCLKELFVLSGRKCSWHYHEKKHETFWVVRGELLLRTLSNQAVFNIKRGLLNQFQACSDPRWWDETVLKPHTLAVGLSPGTLHQFQGVADTYLMEGSTQHFDEDSIRIINGD